MSDRTRLDYGKTASCWEERSEPIVRFWIADQWLLFPFFSFIGGAELPEESVSLSFAVGTVLITGPKAGEFCNAFCSHRATLLKPDGVEITAVTFTPRAVKKEPASD